MLFLSTLHDAPVYDSALKKIGTLQDIVAVQVPDQYSPLKAIVVKSGRPFRETVIPWQTVENASRESVTLTTLQGKLPLYQEQPDDIRLRAAVLDHQIIDVHGARVVRVNDLQLGVIDGKMSVVGIDVSLKGLLRRLRLDAFDVFDALRIKLIDWRQAKLVGGGVQVNAPSKDVVHMPPADLANIIEDLNVHQGSALMKSLDLATAARVFEEIDPKTKRLLVDALGTERVAQLTTAMPIDELVDLLKSLPEATEKRLMQRLQEAKAKSAEALMQYPDRSAGGLMTTDFIHCAVTQTVGDVVENIRTRSPNFRFVHYVYIADAQGVFCGVTSIRRLLLNQDRTAPISSIMRERKGLKVLKPWYSLRKIAAIMTKYRLFSVAVLDKEKRAIGVVTIDDVMRALFPYA
ncbi:hypothetical protein A3J43_01280 [Candidatus Uhrbacteria bacterium RIFCSPHIGHO2_12_FULL_54_23]|uniref:CBS domain-containing protein n=2 Tax=Candidatus Uhriibacteriota TaxID=1752732 RepID=A0A1F7UMR8_9BACT|nr:MAG: hypothetical protein A3J43_01280 [Candidatus Uhrbacteria bacterium RIFCSPHIGHO2_12_FULL_54_23]OGL84131.1 MAG: hypothetical protein A3B36_01650 [Candidatus Uhrbacteria bacterium RIFCSPLOWO2_01_FULL_55_36]